MKNGGQSFQLSWTTTIHDRIATVAAHAHTRVLNNPARHNNDYDLGDYTMSFGGTLLDNFELFGGKKPSGVNMTRGSCPQLTFDGYTMTAKESRCRTYWCASKEGHPVLMNCRCTDSSFVPRLFFLNFTYTFPPQKYKKI